MYGGLPAGQPQFAGQPAGQPAVQCSHCLQPIGGRCLMAFGLPWHPNCLACCVCGKTFENEKIFEGEDGQAYCSEDFAKTFAPKCVACEKSIFGEYKLALGRNWHKECFICDTCRVPLDAIFYPSDDGQIYCHEHIWTAIRMICAKCEKPIITGNVIEMGELKFHVDHFCCAFCQKKLANAEYYEREGKPYCKQHYIMLYG